MITSLSGRLAPVRNSRDACPTKLNSGTELRARALHRLVRVPEKSDQSTWLIAVMFLAFTEQGGGIENDFFAFLKPILDLNDRVVA